MARKHHGPAALAVIQAVAAAVAAATEGGVAGPAPGLLVAVSGGSDSVALAAGAAVVARRAGLDCRALTIDHQLQAASAAMARHAVDQMSGLGLACEVVRVDVGPAGGPEAAARAARYAALEAAASDTELILLGHTRDDQAETVLLGLARGSGIRSLAGMPGSRGRLLRPLLGIPREVVAAAAAEFGLTPVTDPHNADPRYARVRVRTQVLPVLEATLGPGVAAALARTAELARADADLLDDLAAAIADPADCAALAAAPGPLRTRALKSWLLAAGATELSATHIGAVEALVVAWRGQGPITVPGLVVHRRDGRLVTETPSHPAQPVGSK